MKISEKNNVIDVRRLDYQIDNADILNCISLEVKTGEFVGLIGPNGCGKSTLLKHIYRHYESCANVIFLNGQDIRSLRTKEIAKQMAVVVQENQVDFDFSVMEMVEMGRYAHKKLFESDNAKDRECCRKALEMVGLYEERDRSFLSLSGGEKQRIYLAMAFAQESNLIVLDEPTNHLDIGYQMMIMDTLSRFKNKTIFTSVHDMNLAAWFCSRLICMDHGKIIAAGTPEQVLTKERIRDVFHVNAEVRYRQTDHKLQIDFMNAIESAY